MAQRGRPRRFDRDVAVERAMHLFWQFGYAETSLSRLKEAMGGITPPSFYAAFGSKEALFGETLERYVAGYGQVISHLYDDTLPPREAVERCLRASARMQTDASHPLGCLVALNSLVGGNYPESLRHALERERARIDRGFRRCVARGLERGELKMSSTTQTLPMVLDIFLQGLTPKAREGASFSELDDAITQLLKLWDAAT